jgi:hypothetical protein
MPLEAPVMRTEDIGKLLPRLLGYVSSRIRRDLMTPSSSHDFGQGGLLPADSKPTIVVFGPAWAGAAVGEDGRD